VPLRAAFLILTTRCNRSCSYCFYETGYLSGGDPAQVLPVGESLLESLEAAGVAHLILTGGEPLLLPGLEDTIRRASSRGFTTLLLTNADLLTAARIERLVLMSLDAISISLDHLDPEKGFKAPWEILRQLASDRRMSSTVIIPISRGNIEMVPEMLRRVSALGLYALIQPVFIPRSSPEFENFSLSCSTLEELRSLKEIIDGWTYSHGASRYADLICDFYTQKSQKPESCSMGTVTIVIRNDGEVLPCFHREDLSAGNILKSNPASVFKKAFDFGARLKSASCFGDHCISLFSHL